ncbi:MAG: 4-hydroxy-tetrahydrodipicolinate synthase [Clostridia bacterium]|nr:4-hydroxy-tetrahydrodipicolinate synthase [Clostridia bacterium]MBR2908684.1 4-hydroxy-tetrahydrodipicolinate synthase [Clostridia bacterium]
MNNGKTTIFTGAATAIITPFRDGAVDYEAFGRIIDANINGGIDAIVVAGTTGEGSTLSHEEHCDVLKFAYERIAGRVPAVAGTGSNDTAYGIELSKYAADIGYEGLLLVTPYYNKATPKGLVKSFSAIADAAKIPVILYNVPSRTGVNIPLSVYKELAKNEYIVATKEASGNLSAIAELLAECGDSLDVYSGNDDQIVPILSLGGKGVISVLSNVMPKETHDICALWFENKVKESAALQLRLLDLINALFCEVNPIPVKAAMEMCGYCVGELRLPLCEIESANREKLRAVMQKHGLI